MYTIGGLCITPQLLSGSVILSREWGIVPPLVREIQIIVTRGILLLCVVIPMEIMRAEIVTITVAAYISNLFISPLLFSI